MGQEKLKYNITYNLEKSHSVDMKWGMDKREAHRKVDKVSSKLISAGLMAAIIAVLELPPRFSFRSHVSTESRYGMKSSFFFLFIDCKSVKP